MRGKGFARGLQPGIYCCPTQAGLGCLLTCKVYLLSSLVLEINSQLVLKESILMSSDQHREGAVNDLTPGLPDSSGQGSQPE